MNVEDLNQKISEFSQENQGSSVYFKEEYFVQGETTEEFAPFSFLIKKVENINNPHDLLKEGYIYQSYDFFGNVEFEKWYEKKFARNIKVSNTRKLTILKIPNNRSIFQSIEDISKAFSNLRQQKILLNGKNLPVQLGEWYARCIFGLYQKKSASQRGFDFLLNDKIVEVKVHWADFSSPKGVNIRRSLIQLSQYCIIIYVSHNLMIREICFLDSDYIIRKLGGKGHTIFLKDSQISSYFFSHSTRHKDKIANPTALLKFATPTFALKLTDHFQ
jgi:hypothetical protein